VDMKRLMEVLIPVLFITVATAQDKEQTAVIPADVTEAFGMLYPGMKDAVWSKVDLNFEVSFTKNEKGISLLFDKLGDLKEVRNEISLNELPSSLNQKIVSDYEGWKIVKVARIDIRGGFTYEVETEKEDEIMDLIFNTQGLLLKNSICKHDLTQAGIETNK
jgi:hypothetical protein